MAQHESISGGRLWGIDVIAVIFGVATLMMVWLFFSGTGLGVAMAVLFGPVCATFAIGMAQRVNWVRIFLMIFSLIGAAGNVLLILYLVGAIAGLFPVRPNIDPVDRLMDRPFNLATELIIYFYLRRPDVRAAFQSKDKASSDEPIQVTSLQ